MKTSKIDTLLMKKRKKTGQHGTKKIENEAHLVIMLSPCVCSIFVLSSIPLSAELITSLLSLSVLWVLLFFFHFIYFSLSLSCPVPSTSAGSDHNLAAHHNSPLEGFQKLVTKKVKGLWPEWCVLVCLPSHTDMCVV